MIPMGATNFSRFNNEVLQQQEDSRRLQPIFPIGLSHKGIRMGKFFLWLIFGFLDNFLVDYE